MGLQHQPPARILAISTTGFLDFLIGPAWPWVIPKDQQVHHQPLFISSHVFLSIWTGGTFDQSEGDLWKE